jgi:hypothetical protein
MSLEYRKERISKIASEWGAHKVNDLFIEWEIPKQLFEDLKLSIKMYVSKAMGFGYVADDDEFINLVELNKANRANITPNGGVVPKQEYSLEYNLFLRSWCEMVRVMVAKNPGLLKRFRLTPNIRIKFAKEIEENVGRGLDTALPHSDAWVEGPWGMNCHLPVIGDVNNNYLHFYKLKDESSFEESYLDRAATYNEMSWVVDKYEDDNLIPKAGYINVSDYALIHKTMRRNGCGARISIDTTIFIGEHDVHPDRRAEYMDCIPFVGQELYIATSLRSGEVADKRTHFSHYTTGSLRHINLKS